jgi:sulfite reductase (NADPH) flavoprotein alpha-component
MASAKGWSELMPMHCVDRQSAQDFARWGRSLGAVLGIPLEMAHQPLLPAAQTLTLISRQDFGAEVQVPMAILRFAIPAASLWQRLTGQGFAGFEAGDLLGILPQGSRVPRLYSLASGERDGFIEIIVRKQAGGLASGQLMALETGAGVQAFLRRNPSFHAGTDRAPLILIGAGTGVGPFAGFIRANAQKRPIHLLFGLRDPGSDFLYRDEFALWQAEGRLARLTTAVSRGAQPRYVQDALVSQSDSVAEAIRKGAKIMVCGGRDMARGVSDVLAVMLEHDGLTLAMLKAQGRYVEDVY